MGRLDGKTALITGAARGQGAEEARLFAREGARVMLCDLLTEEGEGTAAAIRHDGGDARFLRLDVTSEADWQAGLDAVTAWTGQLDVLVNNAGIINQTGICETALDRWQSVMAVNITGPFLGMKLAAPVMARSGGGAVVNTASIASHLGTKCAGYTASKAALLGLTRTAAVEFADLNIRVNAVCPGIVATEMGAALDTMEPMRRAIPLARHAMVGDIASAVLYLASDEAGFVTGTDLVIDGGFIAAGGFRMVRSVMSNPAALAALKET